MTKRYIEKCYLSVVESALISNDKKRSIQSGLVVLEVAQSYVYRRIVFTKRLADQLGDWLQENNQFSDEDIYWMICDGIA